MSRATQATRDESVDGAAAAPGTWLRPTPLDAVGAPLRVPTRLAGADLDAVTRAPVVGDRRTVDGVDVVETTFVYEDARTLDVMVHLNGLTDGHRTDIRAALLERVDGTDWYALTYLLPADGTWSYRIVARESIPHDVGSERSGWMGVHRDGRPDPLNDDHLRHPHGEASSIFHGPDAPVRAEFDGIRTDLLHADGIGGEADGRAETDAAGAGEPDGADGAATRRTWQHAELTDGSGLSLHFSPSGEEGAPLLVLFDAEQYLTMPVLDALSAYAHALDVVTLDSGTPEQRGEVLPHPERAAARLSAAFDVLADRFDRRYDPDDVIVSGASYGGLASAGLVVHHPELTRRAVAQSASYWFDPERDPRRDDEEPGVLTRCVQEHENLPHRQIIVQVGTDEGTMGVQAQMFAAAAEAACIDVRARQYRGGHDWAWWSHALFDGLDEVFASRRH